MRVGNLHLPYFRDHDHQTFKMVARKKLLWAMVITFAAMIVEIIGGYLSNSIALLSDAGHMFTHFFALLISYIAIRLASVDPCHHRTFGMFRAEVLGALFNGIFLLGVSGLIIYESVKRLISPAEVASVEMLIIAIIGLIVNLLTLRILGGHHHEDRNIKAAFLHMVGDALSSVGVVAGAVIIHFTGFVMIDPFLGIMISLLILVWALGVTRDSVRVLLEFAPRGLDTETIAKVLRENDERIYSVEDMHVTEITENMYNFSAIITLTTDSLSEAAHIIDKAKHLLGEKYSIFHATIEAVPRKYVEQQEKAEEQK
ncbi:MAG: cation diffusion facilitator family transporter [Chitinivibrionales bacterium]|nr:cation diffusion facilitator family transporter [Chitinivibrionales bacterium]